MLNYSELYYSLRKQLRFVRLNKSRSKKLHHKTFTRQQESEVTGTIPISKVKNYIRNSITYEIGSFLSDEFIPEFKISLETNEELATVWNDPLSLLYKEG